MGGASFLSYLRACFGVRYGPCLLLGVKYIFNGLDISLVGYHGICRVPEALERGR